MHIVKAYNTGIGHIDARDGRYLVSFYGHRVRQAWAESLESARFAVRRLAND